MSGTPVSGYEIHVGKTSGPDCERPLVILRGAPEGAASADGRVSGCYLHGLFGSDAFRREWLESIRAGAASGLVHAAHVDRALDALADDLERHVDIDALFALAR
jgi:adenosylcobyric acid synthase